jgi:hypothetical protein
MKKIIFLVMVIALFAVSAFANGYVKDGIGPQFYILEYHKINSPLRTYKICNDMDCVDKIVNKVGYVITNVPMTCSFNSYIDKNKFYPAWECNAKNSLRIFRNNPLQKRINVEENSKLNKVE